MTFSLFLGAGEKWKCLVNGLLSVNDCCTFPLGKEGRGKAEEQRALQHCPADRRHSMEGGERGGRLDLPKMAAQQGWESL